MSPLKVRAVARQIQGMHALEAQALLASVPRKSAPSRVQDAKVSDGQRGKHR